MKINIKPQLGTDRWTKLLIFHIKLDLDYLLDYYLVYSFIFLSKIDCTSIVVASDNNVCCDNLAWHALLLFATVNLLLEI